MKMVIHCAALGLFTLILHLPAKAGPATLDGGGARTTGGAAVVHDGSLGGIGGISTGGAATAKHSFVGQLYDVAGVAVSASPGTVDEGTTRQLDAEATMDDDTTLVVDASEVAWSESSPSLSGISATGLASAAIVYEDTVANVTGTFAGMSDLDGFDLTVLNVSLDDFGTYAGDGIDDDWQVGFFGLDNPDAAPGEDPDGDQQDNTFEFLAGFSPLDRLAFFTVSPIGFSAATTYDIEINKVIPDRTYTVYASGDLQTFSDIGSFSVPAEETDKVVQDPGASEGKTFYKVEISKP